MELNIGREIKYINCGCQKNCTTKDQSLEYGNHKYPFSFFVSFSVEYIDLTEQIEDYFLNTTSEKGKLRERKSVSDKQYNAELYFKSIDEFRGFLHIVMDKHSFEIDTKALHNEDMIKQGLTKRSLLRNAHDIMHKYVNRGFS